MGIIIETQPKVTLIGAHMPGIESKFLYLYCFQEQELLESIPYLLLLEELPKLFGKML